MGSVRVAVFPAPGVAPEVREIAEPALEEGAALLDVELSEVCGTDVHLHHGRLAGVPYPLVPGHVSVGRLSKIRGSLRDVEGRPFAEGDRVTFLDVHRTCNACWYCLVGKATTRCPERKVYGITYGLADGLCGGWAEKLLLKPGTRCIRLDDTAPETFLAGGCALPTALHAQDRAEIPIAATVLVLGSGPVGLACVALSRLRGAGRVLCIGAPASRLQVARDMGAHATLDFESLDAGARVAWVRAETGGRGADVTLEATGAPDAVVQAMRCTRDAGRVVVLGQYTDHGAASFNPHLDLNAKHLEIRAAWGSDYSHFHRAVQVARNADLASAWRHLPLERFGLDGVGDAVAAVAGGRVVKALVDPRARPALHCRT